MSFLFQSQASSSSSAGNVNIVPTNLGASSSVAASALTINLVQASGSTADSTNVITIPMRSSTATSGVINYRTVTGALSIVVSSGSTLGHANGKLEYIYLYAIDNAGTIELAVSSTIYNDGSIVTTTAEGGAGAADSATAIYSTTARTNVPLRFLKKLQSTQATAGTWATAIAEIADASIRKFTLGSRQVFAATGTWTRPSGCLAVNVIVVAGGGGGGGTTTTAAGQSSEAGGGGGGGASIKFIYTGLGSTESVTVGTGGTAGATAGGTGGTGNSSSFGAHATATGGSGGTGSANSAGNLSNAGGNGGIGSSGDYNFNGSDGHWGRVLSGTRVFMGAGGASYLGGVRTVGDESARAGRIYGGGGAGTNLGAGGSAIAGGAGADGVVVVDEYY